MPTPPTTATLTGAASCITAHPIPAASCCETDGTTCYTDMAYERSDYILLGRESAGTPRALYAQMDATLTIPMREGLRSLNLAMSAALLLGEACRQFAWTF